MDIIYINDLRIDALIGIYPWERQIRQSIVLDIEMGADIARAAASDQIEDTLSYKDVAKRLIEFVGNSEFFLVETLTEKIADIILTEFSVPWVRVRLNKRGAVRGARDVGILIERGKRN
ncbi:dihydroneopterin aldolase [Candidatus Venteria ishoeyi]|uniref:7,8-dihydroneopterin aldolase n=1 Tax=Candidatus Venteria ishoeyi TaxID=1899563 RepID=A0A1H6F9N4_9GAMM|nr:dihydroneopterin aldolase [Candidatus Venteria ishoeyi]MDM8547139.1 dihydroneopterin aldolase [Candidatus Venteria ishoeyi]SEH06798.1 Dihydroneopterin aldolase [Candidatus Venteria ishoeyi]